MYGPWTSDRALFRSATRRQPTSTACRSDAESDSSLPAEPAIRLRRPSESRRRVGSAVRGRRRGRGGGVVRPVAATGAARALAGPATAAAGTLRAAWEAGAADAGRRLPALLPREAIGRTALPRRAGLPACSTRRAPAPRPASKPGTSTPGDESGDSDGLVTDPSLGGGGASKPPEPVAPPAPAPAPAPPAASADAAAAAAAAAAAGAAAEAAAREAVRGATAADGPALPAGASGTYASACPPSSNPSSGGEGSLKEPAADRCPALLRHARLGPVGGLRGGGAACRAWSIASMTSSTERCGPDVGLTAR